MNLEAVVGWREALLIGVAVLAAYVAVVFVRFQRLKGGGRPKSGEVPSADWHESPRSFAEAQYVQAVERELDQLREEMAAVRGELAALRGELRQQVAQVRATQSVSPLYNDAMQMALRGDSAESIAERCGISRAEADLMVSLTQNRDAE